MEAAHLLPALAPAAAGRQGRRLCEADGSEAVNTKLVIGARVVLGLLVYLVVAVFDPEKFSGSSRNRVGRSRG